MARRHSRKGNGVFSRLLRYWRALPVRNVWLALLCLHLAVLTCGLESAYVQLVTTQRFLTPSLLAEPSFLLLLAVDLLVALALALLSRPVFMIVLIGQSVLSTILLHYTIFFYNPLTLSSIYHSMQGAASLGIDIFGFARWNIIFAMTALGALKILLVQLSRTPDTRMPAFWAYRGATAICCLAVVTWIFFAIYGKTGLSLLWVDSRGHRTATERRLEEGTNEAVHSIGYIATWMGEFFSGTYKDTALIYAEARCADPDPDGCPPPDWTRTEPSHPSLAPVRFWNGLPLPPLGVNVALIQVESLDFAALSMKVNGHTVLPFIDLLAQDSLLLRAFAPHKVGSSNSDYELLNGRIADQNVIYYSYIKEYPNSIIRALAERGYHTALFHGLDGNLFNLRQAYEAQGFKEFHFKSDLLQEGYAASSLIMDHVHDRDVFTSASDHMVPDRPEVQFIITMSTHVPFIDPLPIYKNAGGPFARYVSALRTLDQLLAGYYARLPEGTLLILWGDHGSDVTYPPGFPKNSRHVPFLVHVKGDTSWLAPLRAASNRQPTPVAESVAQDRENAESLTPLLFPLGKVDSPPLADEKNYTLCELAHLLRHILALPPVAATCP